MSKGERNVNLEIKLKAPIVSTGIVLAMVAAGCADMQNRPNTAAPGSTYVNAVRNTGSYGNVNAEQRSRVVGERMWQGRKAFVYENVSTGGSVITEPETGGFIALARGDAPTLSWEPAIRWDFPLEVGKSWSRKHRLTNHANKASTDFVGTWKVEALEDVTVRAGTFKSYRVRFTDGLGTENMSWWSPELGINAKLSNRRDAKHPAGPGTNESELVSRPAMP